MGNWYKVTKKIRGRLYDYWQRTERRGKSVKTFNEYIGPTDRVCNYVAALAPPDHPNYKPGPASVRSPTREPPPPSRPSGLYFCRRREKADDNLDWERLCKTCAEGAHFVRIKSNPASSQKTTPPAPSPPLPHHTTAMEKLNPYHGLDGKTRCILQKAEERQRREDEAMQYGPLKTRLAKHAAKLKAAKKKSRGTGAINPFLGQGIKKQ